MGGKKKLSLSQRERLQARRRKEKEARQRKSRPSGERDSSGISLPDLKSEEALSELKRMRVLTPYLVASRFGIRLSVAKDVLENLESRGLIEFVSRSRKTKVYRIAA